jgi:hypothetical protein
MTEKPLAYVVWYEEEADTGAASRVQAASLVCDVGEKAAVEGSHPQVLAYLGPRPGVTAALVEELTALYPEVVFDWDEIRRALATPPGATDVAGLSDDELALRLRELAHERGLTLMDLALRLGYDQRQVLPEAVAFLEDPGSVARFERTSGSIVDYLDEKHLDYAFLLYKARLYFEGDEQTLTETIAAEPRGFGDEAWQSRRLFWTTQLRAYRQRRKERRQMSPPGSQADESQ